VADFVTAVCSEEVGDTAERLLAVGHSSGAALAAGVLYVLTSASLEGAA
jgi:predicted esterase